MEEFPTFTKWLTTFGHSGSCNDAKSKSKQLNPANRPLQRPPVVLPASSEDAVPVVTNVPEEEGVQTMAVDGSISARGGAGCCCWQSSKSTRRECALKFHISLRKRKVVANSTEAEVVAAVLNPPEEATVEDVKDGCGCRCLRTFQIFRRRKSRVVGVSDLQKEEGAVTDGVNLRTEEVASSGSDMMKEEEVVIAPDRRKEEESGCCCGRWKCSPTFQICRRRKVVAGKEEVVGGAPKVEEVGNDNVTKQEEDSVGCLQAFHICGGRKRVDDNPKTSEKEPLVSNDSSNLDVQNLQKEECGCCSCFRCRPTFQICGGRRSNEDSGVPKPGREEKVIVDVSDPPEMGSVVDGRERHSRPVQGGTCWSGWFPRFLLCGEGTAVDAPNHREEEEKAPSDARKEEKVVVATAVGDEISDHDKEKPVAAIDIPVVNEEEVFVGAGDTLDLHKEKNVSSCNIQDVRKEEIVDSDEKVEGGGCGCWGKESGSRQQHRSSRSMEGRWSFQICGRGCLPTLNICRGRKDVSVRISKLVEEGLVDNDVSDVHKEVVDATGVTDVVAGSDNSKCRRGCGCWNLKSRRRRAVAVVDKEGGSGRRSKFKGRKGRGGWLRRSRRKEREGKEKNR